MDDNKQKNEELTDEQLNEASGGYKHPEFRKPVERDTCYLCKKIEFVNEMKYVYLKGERRLVCFSCLGLGLLS
jgi:hypothetical protein